MPHVYDDESHIIIISYLDLVNVLYQHNGIIESSIQLGKHDRNRFVIVTCFVNVLESCVRLYNVILKYFSFRLIINYPLENIKKQQVSHIFQVL